jgi:crossover junction endodeoxyribonuclease RusA
MHRSDSARLAVTLPLPPSVNHLYYRARHHVFLTAAARDYHAMVALALRGQAVPADARVALTLVLYFPDRRRRDLDNALKLLLDAVSRVLGFDDAHIEALHVYRALDRARPRAEVTLTWSAPHV